MDVILFRDYREENWHSMEVYADSLARNLKALYGRRIRIREHITLPGISRLFPSRHKHIRHLFRYIVNPSGSLFRKAEIYHISDHANAHLLAVLDPGKTVVTCHDLTAPYWMMGFVKPTAKKRIKHAVERWRLGFLRRAARVIAVSEATKEDIIRRIHIPENRIVVIPEGVDARFRPVREAARIGMVVRKYGLPERYILNVGTTYYNKNIEGLLALFFSLAERDGAVCLVKAGDPWTSEQQRMISTSRHADRVLHLGFVDGNDLPAVYSCAKMLLQPSHAEGFGFTVLEAMACGCPVAVSDIPAHQELVGNAGLYIPADPADRIRKLSEFLTDSRARASCRRLGLVRAKSYTWKKCAERTYQVYQEVLSERGL